MDSALKKKLKNAAFVINGDIGEKYYQIHVFEDTSGLNSMQISSKINKTGQIEIFSRTLKDGIPITATTKKPCSKKEFKKSINYLEKTLGEKGFVHSFTDLSQCPDIEDALNLIKKTSPHATIEIKHKSDL